MAVQVLPVWSVKAVELSIPSMCSKAEVYWSTPDHGVGVKVGEGPRVLVGTGVLVGVRVEVEVEVGVDVPVLVGVFVIVPVGVSLPSPVGEGLGERSRVGVSVYASCCASAATCGAGAFTAPEPGL